MARIEIPPEVQAELAAAFDEERLDLIQQARQISFDQRQSGERLGLQARNVKLQHRAAVQQAERDAAEEAQDRARREASRKDTPTARLARLEQPVEPNAATADPAQLTTADLSSVPVGSQGGGPQFIQEARAEAAGAGAPVSGGVPAAGFVPSARQTTETGPYQWTPYMTAPATRTRTDVTLEPDVATQQLTVQRELALAKLYMTDRDKYIGALAKSAANPQLDGAQADTLLRHAARLGPEALRMLEAKILEEKAAVAIEQSKGRGRIGKVMSDLNSGLITQEQAERELKAIDKGQGTTIDLGLGARAKGEIEVAAIGASNVRDELRNIRVLFNPKWHEPGAKLESGVTSALRWSAGMLERVPGAGPIAGALRPSDEAILQNAEYKSYIGQLRRSQSNLLRYLSGVAARPDELVRIQEYEINDGDLPEDAYRKLVESSYLANVQVGRYALWEYHNKEGAPADFSTGQVAAFLDDYVSELMESGGAKDFNEALAQAGRALDLEPGYAAVILKREGLID